MVNDRALVELTVGFTDDDRCLDEPADVHDLSTGHDIGFAVAPGWHDPRPERPDKPDDYDQRKGRRR